MLSSIVGHKKPVTHMRLAGGLLYASGGRKVRVWDVEEGEKKPKRNEFLEDAEDAMEGI